MKKGLVIIIGIAILSFLVGSFFYPQMPERMASHWNARGVVDGYASKCTVLFLFPAIILAMLILYMFIPKIDPLKANLEKFRAHYDRFWILMVVFMFFIYALTLLWNMGVKFNIIQVLSPAIGIIFYYCGVLVENTKRNWFVGIRTPWTMMDDDVWKRTHQLGGKLFKAAGLIAFLGVFLTNCAVALMVGPALIIVVYTFFYSYFEYKKKPRKKTAK